MHIKYIIDVDGFTVNNKFKVKELGFYDRDHEELDLKYYRVGEYSLLSSKDQFQARWVKNHVHGLEYKDFPGDEPEENIHYLLWGVAKDAINSGSYIGYKGGQYEANLLKRLGFSEVAVNIETFGVKKFSEIVGEYQDFLEDSVCMRHSLVIDKKSKQYTTPHCPRLEVLCFHKYLKMLNI